MLRFLIYLSAIGWGVGCSPSLSTLQPARIVPAGHLQLTASGDYAHTGGSIEGALRTAQRGDYRGRLTPTQIAEVLDAAMVGLVQAPMPGFQLSAAYGLSRHLELGVRTSGNTLRGHVRLQWLRESPGFYGSVAVGVSGHLYGFPLQTITDDLAVERYERWDLDIPLHIGFSSRYAHVWAGPKLVVSQYETGLTACIYRRGGACQQDASVAGSGSAIYLMGQLGVAIGYERFWVAAELSVGHIGATGAVHVAHPGLALDHPLELEGLIISPSLGFILWL